MKNLFLFILVFVCSISNIVLSQGGDNAAAASGSPITLPFSANGTTSGRANDYNNPSGYVSAYTTGPDWLYYFCASTSGSVTTNIFYTTTSGGVSPSISIWEGVPGAGGILIDAITSPGDLTVDGSLRISYPVVASHCYYIMIDNWPTPNGFDYDITTYLTPIQPTCTNIGFENGTTSGWTATHGVVDDGIATAPYPVYTPTSFTASATQHQITTAGNDPVVGAALPRVCPGLGPNSLRLGDGTGTGAKGASIEQRFSVTSANALFTYYYAVVFQDNGHSPFEQPVFRVDVLDCDGHSLTCGDYLVVASATAPGFVNIPSTIVYYKTWTPVFIDLTPYIGSCITIRFTTGDCTLSGHYGYAYIDATCNPMAIAGPTAICAGTNTTLTAPSGGAQYSWTVQGSPTPVLGTAQTLTVSPTVNTTYQCVITSVTNCQTVITQSVNVNPLPVISGNLNSCIGGTSSLSATNSPSLSNPWTSSNPAVASVNTSGLVSGLTSGSSTITYTDINGCTTTALFTVNPNPTISGTSTICIGSTSQLIGSATAAVSSPWVSSNTSVATISSTGLVSGISAGTTTITYTNTNGCIQTYLITVLNPPNITNPGSITRCDSYTLPAITGSFLTSNANYYTASQASSGVLIANGASITTSQTVWIYDNNGTCSDEESFVVTINTTPVIPNPINVTACDSYTLPALTVGNYFTATGGTGTALTAGASITSTQTVYIYAQTGTTPNCTSEKNFVVTINTTPVIPNPINVTACDSYALPVLTVGNYFTA
ncbi:MAG: Ig-like domain-containing protein, partial [Fluviicola sp.]|nr:Ig-like domain-containing protein [Fluviicola sp.]